MAAAAVRFESRHVRLEALADGVWAALHASGGWAVGNAGIVDLGGRTLLFDTFLTVDAAHDLARAARLLTGRSPDVVVLSHYHNDHTRGSEAFADAALVATAGTRALLATEGPLELASDRAHAAERLAHARAMLGDSDPVRRASAEYFAPYWEGLASTAPSAAVRLPDVTAQAALTFHGRERSATLVPYGAERFVPGHGPVGTLADVWTLHAHIGELLAIADGHARAGTEPHPSTLPPSGASRAWTFAYPFYAANLRHLWSRQLAR